VHVFSVAVCPMTMSRFGTTDMARCPTLSPLCDQKPTCSGLAHRVVRFRPAPMLGNAGLRHQAAGPRSHRPPILRDVVRIARTSYDG
jgi:hypothetical protein